MKHGDRRSSFVTVLAWVAIIGGAVGVLGATPSVTQPSVAALAILLVSIASLITGIGLRARRDWARRGFIGVLACSAILTVVGAFRLRSPTMSDIPKQLVDSAPGLTQQQIDTMTAQLRPLVLVLAFVSAIVSVFLIAKLASASVRGEFAETP